jgi:hypothetical protein
MSKPSTTCRRALHGARRVSRCRWGMDTQEIHMGHPGAISADGEQPSGPAMASQFSGRLWARPHRPGV